MLPSSHNSFPHLAVPPPPSTTWLVQGAVEVAPCGGACCGSRACSVGRQHLQHLRPQQECRHCSNSSSGQWQGCLGCWGQGARLSSRHTPSSTPAVDQRVDSPDLCLHDHPRPGLLDLCAPAVDGSPAHQRSHPPLRLPHHAAILPPSNHPQPHPHQPLHARVQHV